MSNSGRKRSGRNVGCQGGCAGCGCVLTLGLILTLIGAALGISISARIPTTHSNVTLDGSIGKKELTLPVLPAYARRTFGANTNLINSSNSVTIGPAQGRQQFVVGQQAGAPLFAVQIYWKRG